MSLCFHSRFARSTEGSNEDVKKFNVANMKTRCGKETAALKDNSHLWQTIREKTACLNKSSYKTLKRSYGGNCTVFQLSFIYLLFLCFQVSLFVFYIYFSSDAQLRMGVPLRTVSYAHRVIWTNLMVLDDLKGRRQYIPRRRERMVFVLL